MPSNAILQEVRQLYNVSDRLDLLAEEHPVVSEALITISGTVRTTTRVVNIAHNAARLGNVSIATASEQSEFKRRCGQY
jgi:hypothetical protein